MYEQGGKASGFRGHQQEVQDHGRPRLFQVRGNAPERKKALEVCKHKDHKFFESKTAAMKTLGKSHKTAFDRLTDSRNIVRTSAKMESFATLFNG